MLTRHEALSATLGLSAVTAHPPRHPRRQRSTVVRPGSTPGARTSTVLPRSAGPASSPGGVAGAVVPIPLSLASAPAGRAALLPPTGQDRAHPREDASPHRDEPHRSRQLLTLSAQTCRRALI